jgi:hypothetical protein
LITLTTLIFIIADAGFSIRSAIFFGWFRFLFVLTTAQAQPSLFIAGVNHGQLLHRILCICPKRMTALNRA